MSGCASSILVGMSTVGEVTGLDQPGFGGAFGLCREALDDGGTLSISDASEPIAVVRERYRHQQERSTQVDSAPTVGVADALAALEATDAQAVRTAFVQHEQWPWLFVLLVEPTGRALACIGVNHPRATPVDPFPSARRVSQHRWTTRDSPGAGQDEGTGEQGA